MAYRRLNDLRLIKEYCTHPDKENCQRLYCYNDEYQCGYWKQIFKRPFDDFYTIRQGSCWTTECKAKGAENDK